MNKECSKWICVLTVALLILPVFALADDPWDDARWRVNISYNLDGAQWPAGANDPLIPTSIAANIGESMPHAALGDLKSIVPVKPDFAFMGWSVLFTNPKDGTVIFDGGQEIWDLDHPFDYYPGNPLTMNCLMTARWRAAGKPIGDVWMVHVSHDLKGGSWPDGQVVSSYTLTAVAGQPMAKDSLDAEKLVKPYMAESVFLGWSVLFTDAANGNVIYDGRAEIWDLNHPFDYYPGNPQAMNCLMIANWQSSQSGAGSALPKGKLPDGRAITWPFAAGTDPLPEIPPPAHQIIPGTTWLTGAVICGIDEGTQVPVFAFPVYNGPVMDWVGLDDSMDYGLYLGDGWVMLYSPRWPEASGIGFIDHLAVDFPGAEE